MHGGGKARDLERRSSVTRIHITQCRRLPSQMNEQGREDPSVGAFPSRDMRIMVRSSQRPFSVWKAMKDAYLET